MLELRSGRLFGQYEIYGIAGRGGMGVVYRARQRRLERDVALKVISSEIADGSDFRARFARESRLAASIDHPHVVSVYDAGEDDGELYLAMQWIEGADLRSLIDESGELPPRRAVTIATQIADALDAAHAKGLLHRDVKPGNILIRRVGGHDHAYLTDFGVARPSEGDLSLTKTGQVLGTAGYLAPEQIRGEPGDGRSDVYALGCVLFEMLTGEQPFHAKNEMALRWAHASGPRPHPSERLPELGDRFDGVVMQAMAIDPNQRFASAAAFASALQHVARSATPPHGTAATLALGGFPGEGSTSREGYRPTRIEPHTPIPSPPYGYAPGGTPPPVERRSPAKTVGAVVLVVLAAAGGAVGAVAATGGVSKDAQPVKATRVSHAAQTKRPLARPAAGTPTTTSPAAPPSAPPPSSGSTAAGGAAAQSVVENYWSAINNHEFAKAYSYYSQHERDTQAGGESAWIAGHEREGIQSATGTFSVGDISGDSATINVDSLQTIDNANGCQNWAGSYSMVREGSTWLIDRANLTPSAC